MMQKTLWNKTCFNLFGFTVRKNLGISLLSSVLVLIYSPFLILQIISINLTGEFTKKHHAFTEIYSSGAVIMAVVAIGIFILFLYKDFSYLYNKSASDTFHSMPIKRVELLVSKFCGAYVSSLIPLITGYLGFVVVLMRSEVSGSVLTPLIGFLYTALLMIFCGVFALVFILSAGSRFDAITSLITFNIGFPIIVLIFTSICEDGLFGFDTMNGMNITEYSTPFVYSIYSIAVFGENPDISPFGAIKNIIIIAIITVALAVLCYFLYNRRKNEKVTSSYAFAFMPAITGTIVSIISYQILGSIFYTDKAIINIAGIIGALLGSLIFNVITNRGFKKIKASFVIGGVAVILVVLANLIVEFDVFGYETYIPNEENIAEVKVEFYNSESVIDEKELVTSLHGKLIELRDEDDTYINGLANEIGISYQMKSGVTVRRRYVLPYRVGTQEKTVLIEKYVSKAFKKEFEETNFNTYVMDFDGKILSSDATGKQYSINLTRGEMEKLINAYCDDIKNLDYEKFAYADAMGENYQIYAYDMVDEGLYDFDTYAKNYMRYFVISDDFVKTKEVINSIDIENRNTVDR